MEGQLEAIGNNVIVNRLEVTSVKREHLNSTYKCQASNTKLMMPAEKTVRLELLCECLKNSFSVLSESNSGGDEIKAKKIEIRFGRGNVEKIQNISGGDEI